MVKKLSVEYTMLAILEYMCIYTKDTPVTKYHLINHVKGLSTQRSDRITNIINILESNGYIRSIKTSTTTFYQITEEGIKVYYKWVRDFLEFF